MRCAHEVRARCASEAHKKRTREGAVLRVGHILVYRYTRVAVWAAYLGVGVAYWRACCVGRILRGRGSSMGRRRGACG